MRVLIAASSEVVRAGLESLLATDPTFQVVGSFPIDTAARFEDLQPDIVLLDLESLSDESMSPAIESGVVRNSALVILTDDPGNFGYDCVQACERYCRVKRRPKRLSLRSKPAVTGLVALHPDALHSLLSPIPSGDQPELDSSDQILTPREIEVLRMIAEGLGNKEIASKLRISDHTVKFHISSIFAKLGASNRTEAVTIGIRQGLIMV